MLVQRIAIGLGIYAAVVGVSCPGLLAQVPADHVHDLALLVSPELPCVWPVGMTPVAVVTNKSLGWSTERRDMLIIDEHTGTQWDAPAHFVPPPDSGLPGAGPNGLITGEKVPVWQFCGEAVVIDIREHCNDADNGSSFLIKPELVKEWESKHRALGPGDVVLFKSGYTDEYYKPFPYGDRFVATALRKQTPGWPAPTSDTMEYLGSKGVMTLGLDGASMGPLPDLAVATHQAGGKLGMVWIECGTNLDKLGTTGAFYAMLPAKHAGGSGGECRPIGITEPTLAKDLIERARKKQVVDLSVTLHEDYPVTWLGREPGEEASRYVSKTLNAFSKARGPYFAMTHILDSQAGTHVVLPSTYLPPAKFDRSQFSTEIRNQLAKFETKFGKLGSMQMTIDQAPLNEMMGRARVIDVTSLVGSTDSATWPASPVIPLDAIKNYEKQSGPIAKGDVVLFRTGHSDMHYQSFPESPALDPMMASPLAGKSEGWPTPSTEVIEYLSNKNVRCIGTDAPRLGGVNQSQATELNWLVASRSMLVVEFLTNLKEIQDRDAFFIFAPIKIRGTTAGYGRAIGVYK